MIEIRIDDEGLYVRLKDSPRVTNLILQQWMTRVVAYVHAQVDAAIEKGGGLIGRRTGTLARAIMDRVTVTGTGALGEVWPDLAKAPYAAIQEFGGMIVPRNGAALTIPLQAMLTANGVARGSARDVKANPESFGFSSTFIPKGHNVIMGTLLGSKGRPGHLRGQAGSAVPLFALKTSVMIPATHYLTTPFTQSITWIADQLEQLAQDTVHVLFEGSETY